MCGGHRDGHGDGGEVQLYGLQCYLWGKGGLRRRGVISLAGWPGGVLIVKWILLGLKLGLKKVYISSRQRCTLESGNCFTAGFERKFWLSKLKHD